MLMTIPNELNDADENLLMWIVKNVPERPGVINEARELINALRRAVRKHEQERKLSDAQVEFENRRQLKDIPGWSITDGTPPADSIHV